MSDLIKLLFSNRPALGAILTCALMVGGIAFWRYDGYLAKPGRDRIALWVALQEGGDLRGVYLSLLTPALDWLDRFFGDTTGGDADAKAPMARYWTGASFDRCALMAVIYPFASLVIVWVVWSEAAPIGSLFGLTDGASRWRRIAMALGLASIFIAIYATRRHLVLAGSAIRRLAVTAVTAVGATAAIGFAVGGAGVGAVTDGAVLAVADAAGVSIGMAIFAVITGYDPDFFIMMALIAVFGVVVTIAVSVAGAVVIAIAVVVVGCVTVGGTGTGACALTCALGAAIIVAATGSHASSDVQTGLVAAVMFSIGFALQVLDLARGAARASRMGVFWIGFWQLAVVATLLAIAALDVTSRRYYDSQSITVMLVLIPLVNVPFDWLSIGLTRALLRWGCRPGAPSPLPLGLLDLALGVCLLVSLSVALVAALQVADWIIVREGGHAVGRVTDLLDRVDNDWTDPANYWAYATLFSTLIPSVLNAVIGAVSVITWWPGPLRRWVVAKIEDMEKDPRDERAGTRRDVQAVLAAQVGVGTAFVGFAFWGLAWLVFEAPYAKTTILWLLRAVTAALPPVPPA